MSSFSDKLELTESVRQEVERIFLTQIRGAIAGAASRDQYLVDYDDQLEGRLPPIGRSRWRNACELNDPLTRESHLQLLALLTQAQRKDPKWQVEAIDPRDAEKATLQEAWLTNKSAEYHLNHHLYDVAYNALRDPCAVLYVGWREAIRPIRKTMYAPRGGSAGNAEGAMVEGNMRDGETEYDEITIEQSEIEQDGCDVRVVDLADFYPYPADAQDIKRAHGVAERMLLTEYELLEGVKDFGYDAEQVKRLIASGPTHTLDNSGTLRERRNTYDGTAASTGAEFRKEDGYYECFLYFSRLPLLRDDSGDLEIPDHLLRGDAQAMACPARQVVFKLDASPFPDRPYILFHMVPRPGRMLGIGISQLLAPLQDEANATLQATIDGINLEMSPVVITTPDWLQKYNAWSIGPGVFLPEDEPGSIRTLEWQRNSALGLELLEAIRSRAQGLAAAEGYGELQAKVRKDSEIQNVMSATDAKFDLFLQLFQMGMEELAIRIVSLHLHFQGDDMQDTFPHNGRKQEIDAQALRGEFRYIPIATSSTSTPQMRLQLAQAKQNVQANYIIALTKAPQQFMPFIWHGARQVLLDMGERQPEQWIGPEPTPQSAAPPELLSLVQSGIPPQVIQQLLTQGPAPA